jgi:protoheme IX farnesyltransferase
MLVASTTACGYLAAPDVISFETLITTVVGTSLSIASANSMNQYIEVEHDLKMNRTADRVLPNGEMSLNHALAFSIITGIVGTCLLAWQVNFLSAGLAFGNIFLYTLVYTPLKRFHWLNTWVGGIVGAIPPMIGWAACTGGLEYGAYALFLILFMWQIPHFLALSWPLKNDYEIAGYKMLINKDPKKVAAITFRYSLYFFVIGPLCYYTGITTEYFIITSTILNLWFLKIAYNFYKEQKSIEARKTFMATLYYLPILMFLMIIHKPQWHLLSDLIPF